MDKLLPVNARAITGPPKMSLLLEAKSMPALIIKPRLILVAHTDDLGWNKTSNQQQQMLIQNLNRITLVYCLWCLSTRCLFVLDNLWNTMMCFQPPSLLIGKVWVPVMSFCVHPIHCKVHWRVGSRSGTCRLISVQPLIGLTIRAFSKGSALWVLEVLCCLY